MGLPTLVVVSGPAGTGKTTLAHRLADAIGCPAVCRDEIKEGMVHARPGYLPEPGDELTLRTLGAFFTVLGALVDAGVSVVAEAAFQDHVWRPRLEPLAERARIRVVHCVLDGPTARERIVRRSTEPRRAAHADAAHLSERLRIHATFRRVALGVPEIEVDTSDGYAPALDEVVAFVNRS